MCAFSRACFLSASSSTLVAARTDSSVYAPADTLHKRAYQHRTANGVESMLCEVLALADEHVQLPASNGSTCSLSASVRDMAAYSKLSDSIFKYIELRMDVKGLEEARLLLHKIHTRQLHRYIGESVLSDTDAAREKSKNEWQEECALAVIHHLRQLDVTDDAMAMVNGVDASDLEVHIVKINYGKGAENPVDHCLFYGREDESDATKIRATQVCTSKSLHGHALIDKAVTRISQMK
jgi:hypothetical protein